ncbi:acyl-CoA N-acyltransferase [Crassisporium funariophilum]|nr:acyl-CoA N-acyltransferase [Crassisporium funariophilum]KAF8154831.1 acyl-CoA N-acyltransferase [Crassisporium funariophilum]KAF8154837.1 acyl-CoA N-acyltransferase [Crassisporium funariophilum]KAF8154842.1 acyl-CoA N-acyltransferase [Crassisporium funariophilum]KAF8154846.1 acyl-CoA N-acyltransferase [Crassisporium funariophilum]
MPSFTPDSALELLFAPELIPEDVKAQLGPDLHMRPLAKTDHSRSHLAVLSVLTTTPELSEDQYTQAFAALRSCTNTYFTLVIVSRATDTIVGVGSVFLEQKFTRGLGKVGHIEDIAVDKSMQGRKLGLRIIHALMGISERMGCYKTILNCSDDNVAFYKKCGFERKENEMAKYHNVASTASTTYVPINIPERLVHTPRL